MSKFSIDELKNLSKKIISEPEKVNELSAEEVVELRKLINPYGNIISSNESWINLSIINWREEFMKKFHTMSLVGYLFRTLEEYEDEEDLENLSKKYAALLARENEEFAKLESPTDEQKSAHEKFPAELESSKLGEIKLRKSVTKKVVERFLNRNFKYNPDKHLRTSQTETTGDPERSPKAAALLEDKAALAPTIEAKMREQPELTFDYLKNGLLSAYQCSLAASENLRSVIKGLADPENDLEDKLMILIKKNDQLRKITADLATLAEPLASAESLSVYKVAPPADVFQHYNRYVTNHYEQLREAYKNLYNEKPDIEFSIIYYDNFKTQEKAREHRIMHAEEFRADVITISNTGVHLLGPFKENRERVDFYNKNTEIIKKMMTQMELDHKLGKDIMEKQVKQKKKKNILENGPDAPGLSSYAKVGSGVETVADLGVKKALTREEQEEIYKQKIKEEQDNAPHDAIEVEVFYPQGEGENVSLNRTHFYTQAETPLHLVKGSQYADAYQPKRNPGESIVGIEEHPEEVKAKKTIVSRTGETREV